MRKFLKISCVLLALLLCTQSWAGDDPKEKGKNTSQRQQAIAKSEVGIQFIPGEYAGFQHLGNGLYGIKCKGTRGLCFVIFDGWLRIESTGAEFEILNIHGTQNEGDTITYLYSLQPLP